MGGVSGSTALAEQREPPQLSGDDWKGIVFSWVRRYFADRPAQYQELADWFQRTTLERDEANAVIWRFCDAYDPTRGSPAAFAGGFLERHRQQRAMALEADAAAEKTFEDFDDFLAGGAAEHQNAALAKTYQGLGLDPSDPEWKKAGMTEAEARDFVGQE